MSHLAKIVAHNSGCEGGDKDFFFELRQACVTNWGSFVLLEIMANVVTIWVKQVVNNNKFVLKSKSFLAMPSLVLKMV